MTDSPSPRDMFLAACHDHGIQISMSADGGLTFDGPRDVLTPKVRDWLKAHRADVVAMLRPNPESTPALPTIAADADYSEWCWSQIPADDYRYLTALRSTPSRCPWCRGRLVHHRSCDELRRSWEPTIPFGRHKGKPLSEVPKDYLEWLSAATNINAKLREAVRYHLQFNCMVGPQQLRAAHGAPLWYGRPNPATVELPVPASGAGGKAVAHG